MSRILEDATDQITQRYKQGIHSGIDVVKYKNKLCNVLAHSEGIVVWIQTGQKNNKNATGNAYYGNCVKIKHKNGMYTLYAHLKTVKVSLNENVKKGQILGYMGNTGNAKGSHLHFEVRNRKDKKRNPVKYLDQDFLIKEDSKYLHYRGFICGENCWQDLVKEEEQYIGVFGYKLGGIFIETNIEDLQFRVYKNIKCSPFVSVNQEALLQEKEGIQGFQIKSNVKLLYRVHVLDSGWTDWFFSTLFYENVLEQENFIDGIQICVRKE